MQSPTPLEIAATIASVISAIGGCAAAFAAFLSARSAREATNAAEEASRRAALREVTRNASAITLEVASLKELCRSTVSAIKSSMAFSGVRSSSGHEELIRQTQLAATSAERYARDAELFSDGAKSLAEAPISEIERVSHRKWENLEGLRTLRRQIEDMHNHIENQNDQHRDRLIDRAYKQ